VYTYGEDITINAKEAETIVEMKKENNLDGCRRLCTNNLDPMLKTNTVDPQGFVSAAANPVYGPYAYLEDSLGMNQRASGAHLA